MRRLARAVLATSTLVLAFAATASATVIGNGTVNLGINAQGSLNDTSAVVGVEWVANGNDGIIDGFPAEGWGAGADGPTRFEGRANQWVGNLNLSAASFENTATTAKSTVDVLRGTTRALRVTHDFRPSPTTPNLYEITVTLENMTGGTLTDVRYERVMDWDVQPTAFSEFVTVNRGTSPPANLIYSDADGFSDNLPFTADTSGQVTPLLENQNYTDEGPRDHGARFTFSFGNFAPGERRELFLYYGAAGTEDEADAAVSAAALEMFSYGQPNVAGGPDLGTPNTFIWGFRAVGGAPIIPPAVTLTPDSAAPAVGSTQSGTATLTDSSGSPVPGAEIVFVVSGTHPSTRTVSTNASGQASFSYSASTAGGDAVTACLDSNSNGACDLNEIADTAIWNWQAPPQPPPPPPPPPTGPQPDLGKSVVVSKVSGTVRVKTRTGRFRTLGATDEIPLGSTVDATRGRVRLTSAAGGGAVQTADFYQGQFLVTQTRGSRPITELRLNAAMSCGKGRASTAQRRKKVRRLWGDGRGRFRTRGRHGAATVRGTRWLTQDRCNSTKFTVRRGSITVRDFVKKRNRVVRQGKSFTVKKKKR